METKQYENLVRVAKHEERERILGIIEYLSGELGDTSTERAIKRMFLSLMKMIEKPTD